MLGPKFAVDVKSVDGTTRVVLEGELDMSSIESMQSAFAEADGQRSLVVDMSDVTFIDSVVLGLLVTVRREHRGLRLITSPAVERLLGVTGTREHFEIDEKEIDDREIEDS